MKARRAHVVAILLALVLVLPAGAAHAAGAGQITSPEAGATVTAPTALVVRVTGRAGNLLDPRDHVVRLRVADDTGTAARSGTEVVDTTCETDCGGDSTWTAGSLAPTTLAPFGATPACNGAYTLQVQVDDGAWAGHGIRLAAAPGAPRDVSVSPGVGQATVRWAPAPDPDLVGYRVQRRRDGGAWQTVAEVGAGTRAHADDGVDPGEVGYRVVALRGDGTVDGAPVAPCTDSDPDLGTPSAAVPVTVRSSTSAAPSRPAAPASQGSDPQAPESGTQADGGADDATPGEDSASEGAGGQAPSAGSGQPARRSGGRVAPPAAMGTAAGPEVAVQEAPTGGAPQVAGREPSYYGDDQEFSEEIDFGDLGAVEAMGPDTVGTRVVRVPGALQGVLGRELDLDRLVGPVAAGLLLLACGLLLRRWTRKGLETE